MQCLEQIRLGQNIANSIHAFGIFNISLRLFFIKHAECNTLYA